MEQFRRCVQLAKSIIESFTSEENKGFAFTSGLAGIYCSWHIATLDVDNILERYALPLKILGGFFTVVIGPPLSVFMKDLYNEKIKPKLFKKKKSDY